MPFPFIKKRCVKSAIFISCLWCQLSNTWIMLRKDILLNTNWALLYLSTWDAATWHEFTHSLRKRHKRWRAYCFTAQRPAPDWVGCDWNRGYLTWKGRSIVTVHQPFLSQLSPATARFRVSALSPANHLLSGDETDRQTGGQGCRQLETSGKKNRKVLSGVRLKTRSGPNCCNSMEKRNKINNIILSRPRPPKSWSLEIVLISVTSLIKLLLCQILLWSLHSSLHIKLWRD